MPIRVVHVAGARPNFMKVSAVMAAMDARPGVFQQTLVHTGQHYDVQMSDVFFAELGLPQPDLNLGVGSGSHAYQTAEVMVRLEPVLLDRSPNWVVLVGDVNSTLAAALTCAKLGIRVAHVEAGLRSFDRSMPEEINRVLTDQLADLLMTTEESAEANLRREGIDPRRIRFVGNVMIDTLVRLLPRAEGRSILRTLGLRTDGGTQRYVVVTLHRPSNVDDPATLAEIAAALADLAEDVRVVFPMHPRTRRSLDDLDGKDRVGKCEILEPLGYLDFLALQRHAALVITDSGGVQEETTHLDVPCLTVRPNTERPVTLTHGTNRLVAASRDAVVAAARSVLASRPAPTRRPPLWDGQAADRAVAALLESSSAP